MNTAAALAVLYDFTSDLRGSQIGSRGCAQALEGLRYWLAILGVAPNPSWLEEPAGELPSDFIDRLQRRLAQTFAALRRLKRIERVIALRADARRAKDWAASDRLRDALVQCGVELHDTKEGTNWSVIRAAAP